MDFIYGAALNLFLNLLLDKPGIQKIEPPPVEVIQALQVEAPKLIDIPVWVTQIPGNCFVGISNQCISIEEARQQSMNSAVTQILQTMGAEYSLTHKSELSGNAHFVNNELNEKLTYTARWFIRSVQQNIRQTDIQQIEDKYICFVLVYCPPEKIERLRILTIGPMVAARIVKVVNNKVVIEVIENNGVQVTITDYDIEIMTKNRHAGVITMFVWKVPESSMRHLKGVLRQKISLRDTSQIFKIPIALPDPGISSLILGAEDRFHIVLHGYDEVGRVLSLPVKKF